MASILVVDDEAGVRQLMRRALEEGGHLTIGASSEAEALYLARRERPDVVLMDFKLSDRGRSGLEVLAEIRRDQPALLTFIVTGHGTQEIAFACGAAHLNGYITKPFRPTNLLEAVNDALEGRDLKIAASGDVSDALRDQISILGTTVRQPLEQLTILFDIVRQPAIPVPVWLACALAIGRIVPMDFAADAVESRFAVLTGRLADIVKRVRAPRQPHLRSALEHLHRAARKQRLVRQSDLAVVAGRSPAQLSRDLKEATGFGFAQLIAAYRLQPAIPGIINGVERIAQQAFTGGYEDLRLFNRDFKRIFSMSPTEMRNCIRRQSELPMAGAVSSPFGRRSTGPAASPRVSIDAMKR